VAILTRSTTALDQTFIGRTTRLGEAIGLRLMILTAKLIISAVMIKPVLPPPPDPPSPEAARRFTLDELCTLANVPKRTVRYYIQIGLLERPEGETRAAHYLTPHLDRLLRIRQLADAGVSLERVREVLSGAPPAVPTRPRGPGTVEVWSHLVVADGLEVQIEPGRAGLAPEQVRALFAEFSAAYARIRGAGAQGD
jgi:DNA-binding transcriptional MerR regulator